MGATRPATGANGGTRGAAADGTTTADPLGGGGPPPPPGARATLLSRALAAWGDSPAGSLALVSLLLLAGVAVPVLGPSLSLHGTGEAAAPGVRGIAALRAVLCAALCVTVGEVYGVRLAHRVADGPAPRLPPSRVVPAATAGFLAALGLASVVSTGNLVPHRLSDVDLGGLYRTPDGVLALVEVNAFLVAAVWAGARRALPTVAAAVAVIAAEALRAHPAAEPAPLVGSALTAVHLACAALWAGGLWQVLRTVRLWRRAGPGAPAPAAAAALLAGYARTAAALPAALTLTGLVSALRRMPPDAVLGPLVTTAYGRTLLAKALLVAVAVALALSARRRLAATPNRCAAPARTRSRPRARAPGEPPDPCSPARAELAVLAAVVVVSALLTALPVPIRW